MGMPFQMQNYGVCDHVQHVGIFLQRRRRHPGPHPKARLEDVGLETGSSYVCVKDGHVVLLTCWAYKPQFRIWKVDNGCIDFELRFFLPKSSDYDHYLLVTNEIHLSEVY